MENRVEIFLSYAHEDEAQLEVLQKSMIGLRRHGLITQWHDREIVPGKDWAHEIDNHLNTAHIILLLVSLDFLASDYCIGIEVKRALERHKAGEARVIPIILRPTDWEEEPFGNLQPLPKDAKPVTTWQDRELAFLDIARGIRRAIRDFTAKTKEQWLAEGEAHEKATRYEEALTAYEQALQIDSNYSNARNGKGFALYKLNRCEEALLEFERAIQLNPNYIWAWQNKGEVLRKLLRKEEALDAYNHALQIDSNFIHAYLSKGRVYLDFELYNDALDVYELAAKVGPDEKWAWHDKGEALLGLKRYKEALTAFDKAIEIDPNNMWAWYHKAKTLDSLARQAHQEAEELGYKE